MTEVIDKPIDWNVIPARLNSVGAIINGHCAGCLSPSTIFEYSLTICERCSKEHNLGRGLSLGELRDKYVNKDKK